MTFLSGARNLHQTPMWVRAFPYNSTFSAKACYSAIGISRSESSFFGELTRVLTGHMRMSSAG